MKISIQHWCQSGKNAMSLIFVHTTLNSNAMTDHFTTLTMNDFGCQVKLVKAGFMKKRGVMKNSN
jgi:hypothetical protein